jgi:hypothetical protein
VTFANDWATSLDAALTAGDEADALVPATAAAVPAPVLANLPSLQVVSMTSTALQIDTGTEPPPGGGFEVRRRDWAFGPESGGDLVLRSPVRSFSIPREGEVERYFVRMYSASGSGYGTPPVYSRFSSAVFTNLPAG